MDSLWVEPTVDGKDSVGKLKSGHLNIDRVKQLVAEFVTTLSPDEWVTNPLLVYKVYYGSKVPATPLNYKPRIIRSYGVMKYQLNGDMVGKCRVLF